MFPTCSKSDLAGRNALSATALTISPNHLWTPRRDLDPPPVHQRADRAPARLDLVAAASGLAHLGVRHRLPPVRPGIARHLLEPRPRLALAIALGLGDVAGALQHVEELIARALELGGVGHVAVG